MTIYIINGANLNLLGKRDPEFYGSGTLRDLQQLLEKEMPDTEFLHFQSNSEGEIIDRIQEIGANHNIDGLIINPGAYAHYSYSIADALADLHKPKVEVHISNILARDEFRAKSVTAPNVSAVITGAGFDGYLLAAKFIEMKLSKK